ncbi:DUF2332 domain-containing protein [Lentibacillus amyloliquefaciens]|uniref:DUF2332 domain-containing protein n=1 Tax=Lentibacillus amyloliquefaciens TaxID=1472767 RepID=A0A0U4E5C1_9BACI|nr:DUF2332 domain-containing protein [Lentibacillus amyloliquefaciens]ALX48460.1 hypothetical protein AOX59_07460 [Lentibacillus amyloliquefaciens]
MNTLHLSQRFYNFANMECKDSSELYEFLSLKISKDDEILELCSAAQNGQPVPNLLFGAVHYLLLKGSDHPLKTYYPSRVDSPKNIDSGTFVCFKEFCRAYKDEIVSILRSKLVQTNEVRRCAYLYPVFSYIYHKTKKPLSLIEIGTSAGLQLLWDKYSYTYGTDQIFGDKSSRVHITSEIKGKNTPSLPLESPPVASKIGLDLYISDLRNSEDYLWLKSLIWPEHQNRLALFENAAECLKDNPVELIEGDGIALLEDVVETRPEDTAICIFHTHVANQIPDDAKHELLGKIKNIGQNRDVFHIYNNMWDRQLHLNYFLDGVEFNQTIGDTDGHGRWFEWHIK